MSENTENWETMELGTIETASKLEPKVVEILSVSKEAVGKGEKIQYTVNHPDADSEIHISEVKLENRGKLESCGLWLNTDKEGKIAKGSALAKFLVFMKANNVKELIGRSIPTVENDKGYLVFKAY